MENVKKKILILFSSCAFMALMMVNLSVSMEVDNSKSFTSLNQLEVIATANAATEDPWGSDCHGGYCVQICYYPLWTYCTAMDCGSGTQMCYTTSGFPTPW